MTSIPNLGRLLAVAALGSVGMGSSFHDDGFWPSDPIVRRKRPSQKDHYTSEKPLTKRQKRRLRGRKTSCSE